MGGMSHHTLIQRDYIIPRKVLNSKELVGEIWWRNITARQSILVIIKRGRIIAVYMPESPSLSISPALINQALQFQAPCLELHQLSQLEL